MTCKNCYGENVIKYGKTSHAQRYFCHDCNSTFTIGGNKKDYSDEFIDNVMDEYCHEHKSARKVLDEYKISSRTLIKWKNKHQEHCDKCKK